MKFNAKQIQNGEHAGKWAVFTRGGFFSATVTESEHEARQDATLRSALWHVEQARKLAKELDGTLHAFDVQDLGFDANLLVDDVVDWCSKHWKDHDVMDPKCWTC